MKAGQGGVAIILAMGVVALAAMVAAATISTLGIWTRESELSADHAQARVLTQPALDWSRALLSDDRRSGNVDHLGEPWALRLPPMPVERGSFAGHIDDEQGRFNVNNLVKDGKINGAQFEHFQRLLAVLKLPPQFAETLADWMLAANRSLVDVDEFSLLSGFTPELRARLRPFVATLPAFTAVNVNTAAPEVLAAVIPDLGLDGARTMVAKRERAYFRDRADFISQLPNGIQAAAEDIAVGSDYFMVSLAVIVGSARVRRTALLVRADLNWPAVVWSKMP